MNDNRVEVDDEWYRRLKDEALHLIVDENITTIDDLKKRWAELHKYQSMYRHRVRWWMKRKLL